MPGMRLGRGQEGIVDLFVGGSVCGVRMFQRRLKTPLTPVWRFETAINLQLCRGFTRRLQAHSDFLPDTAGYKEFSHGLE